MGLIQYLLRCVSGNPEHDVYSSTQATRIVDLPEDVVLNIMSKLNVRDVMNFSILTKQWAHILFCLEEIVLDTQITKKKGEYAFVKSVYLLLRYYRSKLPRPVYLQSLGIGYPLSSKYSACIDQWVAFSFYIGVTTLVLNLRYESYTLRDNDKKYVFPWHVLHQYPTLLKKLILGSCIFRCRLTFPWTSLETLGLYDSPITEYDMDRISHCFPNLRYLVFVFCKVPPKLTFASVSLTKLKIKMHTGLEEVDMLNCKSLVKFTYRGHHVPKMISGPKLTHLKFSFVDSEVENYVFQRLRYDFPEMRILSISRDRDTLPLLSRFYGRMSSFPLLEELKLYCHPTNDFGIDIMTEVLKACPILRRLELIPPCILDLRNDINSQVPYLHKCLTFIKISGFCGSWGNVELTKYLVQVSEALDHVVIQGKVEVVSYWFKEQHSAKWHSKERPEVVKDLLLSLTRSKMLTFSCGDVK